MLWRRAAGTAPAGPAARRTRAPRLRRTIAMVWLSRCSAYPAFNQSAPRLPGYGAGPRRSAHAWPNDAVAAGQVRGYPADRALLKLTEGMSISALAPVNVAPLRVWLLTGIQGLIGDVVPREVAAQYSGLESRVKASGNLPIEAV